jgi:photosystem II stability/assembly factor-like uncharacterized protein
MNTFSRWLRAAIPLVLMSLVTATAVIPAAAQSLSYNDSLYNALRYRCIGPFRGGRSAAVAGVPGEPSTFYFGATGGGVWKTTDAGNTWSNVSDGFYGGSIGAVAVSEWDHNVIYVGGGEVTVRGNVSHGDGMWRSEDEGKTWKHIGLQDSRHIPRITIHPRNPDLVYAAVLGHLYGPSDQRGIYRSNDGGTTWKRSLFVNRDVGAVDLEMDPSNPRVLYASTWRVRRTPYSLESGGSGSGLWKSVDGGDSWTELTRNEGMPKGTIGIIGVTVSPVDPERVWAIVEAEDGGVFRSDDAGKTWNKVNEERKLRQRAWYYTRIYADTRSRDKVYIVNVGFWRSKDGGKTFEGIGTPHGDHHDLWIAPEDPLRMIIADDGGAQISLTGGDSWSTYLNQPTAQLYRVTTDNVFPYRIYGAQQDNSAIRIPNRTGGAGITERDWEPTAGGESGWIAPDPEDPDVVYGGSYGGFLMRYNHHTEESRLVDVWPDNPIGHGAKDLKYRFQWNFPLFFSLHDTTTLYAAGNVLFKTTTGGQQWSPISPDLTRNDTAKMRASGGPITKDNTGVEYYGTIFTAAESPLDSRILWTGSDDGLVYITQDGGKNWRNVTPPVKLMPEWIQINSIEAHPRNRGGLYVAATMYKSDDFRPYLYKTTDFGASWTKITSGIRETDFTRVIRADPDRDGLLYAGTEAGMYISFDDGAHWKPFQLNLPVVPITDLAVKNKDLVVATQGRSFWVLDDLSPLHQLSANVADSDFWLFAPRSTYRTAGSRVEDSKTMGENPPNGALIHYYLAKAPDSSTVALRILQQDGTVIRTFSGKTEKKGEQIPLQRGMNRFVWDLQYPAPESFPGMIMWGGWTDGPVAVPGIYGARLVVAKDSTTVEFSVLEDPRSSSSPADLQAQFDFLQQTKNKINETHAAIKTIRDVRSQLNQLADNLKVQKGVDSVLAAAKRVSDRLNAVEEHLYQTKNQSPQDPLNYPIRLNNKLSEVASNVAFGDYRPTENAVAVRDDLSAQIDRQLADLRDLLDNEVPSLNKLVRESQVPAVIVKDQTSEKVGQ